MDHRIQQLQHHPLQMPKKQAPIKQQPSTSFKDVLQGVQTNTVKVSRHAEARLMERKINIDSAQWEKISAKMSEAKQKGITDSLIVTKDAALIVSTKNNTVVTAMGRKEADSQIFTNINGTIIMED